MPRRHRKAQQISYWPGFIDALLAVVLVLIFLITIFILTQTSLVQVVNSKESALGKLAVQLRQLERALSLSRSKANELQIKLRVTETELNKTTSSLARTVEKLTNTQTSLGETRQNLEKNSASLQQRIEELNAARDNLTEQQDTITVNAEKIRNLTATITEYLDQLRLLNEQLEASEQDVESRDASLAELNLKALDLNKKITALSKQLGQANIQVRTQKLELGKLLAEIDRRDKEIERLRSFEKFRSEFLERLASVFEDQQDIRVVGDRFVFQGEVIFASGSDEITLQGKEKLRKFYQIYKSLETKIPPEINLNIQIQGHTDTDPISTSRYPTNWELSTARSVRVVRHLSLLGIPQNRMSAAGFGEFYPAVPDDTPSAKRQNRRIEILFTRR